MSFSPATADTIFEYIVGDFESAWDALVAQKPKHDGGGNFMFALMAMILLELACRVCAKDKTNQKLIDLTNALGLIETRYFTQLPGAWGKTSGFTLPGKNPGRHLLGMLFDLIRHGKAHQYQSAIVKLSDGEIDIDITGAASGRALNKRGRRRPKNHLSYKISPSCDLSLLIRTDQLFLDIKLAILNSKIISSSDVVSDIARQTNTAKFHYNFTVADLAAGLVAGGHSQRKR